MGFMRRLVERIVGRRADAAETRPGEGEPRGVPAGGPGGVYRRPAEAEEVGGSFLGQVDAAVVRSAPARWAVRRPAAHTWEVEMCEWLEVGAHYTVIAFESPRGVLVLHGEGSEHAIPPNGDPLCGTFMPDVGDELRPLAAFKSFGEFLGGVFAAKAPLGRPAELPALASQFGGSIEPAIEALLADPRIEERFEVRRLPPDDWQLEPREQRGVLSHDYAIVRTRGPEGVLVFCENSDGGPLCFRSQHVVYVPRELVFTGWLSWVLAHKRPNTHGLS